MKANLGTSPVKVGLGEVWIYSFCQLFARSLVGAAIVLSASNGSAQAAKTAMRITLDEAVHLALERNHSLIAARTTIQQNEAQEVTAKLRPNPTLFTDWEYLPFFTPSSFTGDYLHDSTEADIGLSYLHERGNKRFWRYQAAKDATAVTRAQVFDNERQLTFQIATLYTNVQLAESTIELAKQDLESFQKSVDIGKEQYKVGALSENDSLKIELQLLQFQTDMEQSQLARVQALSDLRQLLGYDTIPADYDVADALDYQSVPGNVDDFILQALQARPDLRAALAGVTAAKSQLNLAKANGHQDVTFSANYSHVNAINTATFLVSAPLPVFNHNQGEIARTGYAITQAQQLQLAANGQVLTDVRDAFEGLHSSNAVIQLYRSHYLDISKKSRDISEFSYRRGASSLLDFLDAERTYRATQLAYRQALAAYLLALEQLREAVGNRVLTGMTPGQPGVQQPGQPGTQQPAQPGTQQPGQPGVQQPGAQQPSQPGAQQQSQPEAAQPPKQGSVPSPK